MSALVFANTPGQPSSHNIKYVFDCPMKAVSTVGNKRGIDQVNHREIRF